MQFVSQDSILHTAFIGDGTNYSWKQEQTNNNAKLYKAFSDVPWVPWGAAEMLPHGGKRAPNLYPVRVEEMYIENSIFQRVVNDNAGQIKGEGTVFEGAESGRAADYFAKIGIGDQFLERSAYDIALFNGMSAQIIWDGFWLLNKSAGTVSRVEHTKFSRVRSGKLCRETMHVPNFYASADWSVINFKGKPLSGFEYYAPKAIETFDRQGECARQMWYDFKYSPVTDYYPLPDMESAYEQLSLSNDIILFQRKYVQNGMVSSGVVYYPFIPEASQPGQPLSELDRKRMDEITNELRKNLTGAMQAGRLGVVFWNPANGTPSKPAEAPRIENPVEEKNDTKFLEVNREARQQMLTGLGVVSQELMGIPSAGGFSSQADMLLTANELSYNKIIRPKQDVLLRFLNRLLSEARIKAKVGIANSLPVSQSLTVDMVSAGIFTNDEFREAYGYAPMTSQNQQADPATGLPLPSQRQARIHRVNFGNDIVTQHLKSWQAAAN